MYLALRDLIGKHSVSNFRLGAVVVIFGECLSWGSGQELR